MHRTKAHKKLIMMHIKQLKIIGSLAALSTLLASSYPSSVLAEEPDKLARSPSKLPTSSGDAHFSSDAKLHSPLPEALTSFGATVVDDYLYVFSGHGRGMHGFGKDLLVNHFRRIRFDDPAPEATERETMVRRKPSALYRKSAAVFRWMHIYISMLSFTALLFFSLTVITLNHPTWFGGGSVEVRDVSGTLPADLTEETTVQRIQGVRTSASGAPAAGASG